MGVAVSYERGTPVRVSWHRSVKILIRFRKRGSILKGRGCGTNESPPPIILPGFEKYVRQPPEVREHR